MTRFGRYIGGDNGTRRVRGVDLSASVHTPVVILLPGSCTHSVVNGAAAATARVAVAAETERCHFHATPDVYLARP